MAKGKRSSVGTARNVVRILILVAIVIGLCVHTGFGTYSSAGIGFIASVCPLGALEALCGSLAFVPRLIIGLVVMLLVIFVFGRAFCSWVCPVPPMRGFLRTKKGKAADRAENEAAGALAFQRYQQAELGEGTVQPTKGRFDSRHAVLLGALGTAAIFGFPVFCLICPVGLSCALLVLFMRLMGVGELSVGLLIIPVVLILEMTVLRNYCAKICPIGALMSLVGRANRTFRPKADPQKCLRSAEGAHCHACASACPVHIDPRADFGQMPVSECTRCNQCADACPGGAISFPVLPTAGKQDKDI